jgi:ABC-type glycerol-3-phosphate transport system substrate-binding protein
MHIRPFEIALIGIFSLAALGGLLYLANMKSSSEEAAKPYGDTVVVWGTFPQREVSNVFGMLRDSDKAFSAVSYRQIDERSFEGEFVNAIAEGNSPDLILIPHTLIVTLRSKLTAISPETLDERTFRNTYIDGAEIFRLSDGTYALPLGVDPLVLFWNRDIFSNAGIATPPKTWEMLVSETTPQLTVLDTGRTLKQSAIGMGEFINVNHAKEILAMLFFQAGISVVEEKEERYEITLATGGSSSLPIESVLKFYTQFASPASSAFTWTRSTQFDRNAFTAGKLAMYLGTGSEINDIEDENPNMNFDIAPVPQAQGATALRNHGMFYGLAIPKASRNVGGAYRAAVKLTDATVAGGFAEALELTPVLRALYGTPSTNVYGQILRDSALISRGWLDPAPKETTDAMKTMVDGVTSGRKDIDEVINDFVYTLETLFR